MRFFTNKKSGSNVQLPLSYELYDPIFAKFDWFIFEDHAQAGFNAFWTSRTNIELAIERNNWKFHTIFEKHEGWSDEKKFQLKSSLSNHYFAKIHWWPFASVSLYLVGGTSDDVL
jgi:hypothetical protein